MKDYIVKIDCRKCYNQLINNDFKRYENIREIASGKGDDYATGCLSLFWRKL